MRKNNIALLVLLAISIAVLAGLFASSNPDGLEKVAGTLGFGQKAQAGNGVFIDYQLPAFPHPFLSTVLAGIFGVLLILFIFHSIIHLKHIVVLLTRLMKAEKIDNDVR